MKFFMLEQKNKIRSFIFSIEIGKKTRTILFLFTQTAKRMHKSVISVFIHSRDLTLIESTKLFYCLNKKNTTCEKSSLAMELIK